MLSLCLENAELKERMGEATSLLESGEQEEAGPGGSASPEPRRTQRKGRGALGDRQAGGSGDSQGLAAERGAVPTKRPALEARCRDDAPKRPCPSAPGRGDGSHVSAAGSGMGPGTEVWGSSQPRFPFQQEEGTAPGGGWPGLGAELRSQVAQGQKQCQELQDKLAASEATVRAQAEQLEKYHVLLRESWGGRDGGVCAKPGVPRACVQPGGGHPELTGCPAGEPHAQQLSKQVQVDFQDLGYETCGRSETEVDRDETTSPGKESRGLWGPHTSPVWHGKVTLSPLQSARSQTCSASPAWARSWGPRATWGYPGQARLP